jgi:hypothetical protein
MVRDDEPRLVKVPLATFGKYEDVQRRIPDNRGDTHPGLHAHRHPRGRAAAHDRVAARSDGARRPPVIHVVVPAFNEAGNMPALLASIAERLEPLAQRHRIVVVDDGSTDGTADACARAAAAGVAR